MGNTGTTIGRLIFGSFESLDLNVLGIGVVCCICICIVYNLGYSRRRAPVYDPEHCLPHSHSTLEQRRLLADPGPDYKNREPRFLDPFALAEMEKHEESKSSLMTTSGYLAAKADVDGEGDNDRTKISSAEGDSKCTGVEAPKAAVVQTQTETETDGTTSSSSTTSVSESDDQQAPWRRHSYPQDQERKGVLQETSTHHETEHLPDAFHADVIWRRRTIVFEGGRP
ncbi:hypothetical protein LTR47_005851 [Exophiala xenobiotica]|nr:hypothetical protein LTR92_008201 [Exophiala xenobiotica]KAK5207918.1 hypothetical protein LTR41_006430 [Exophiala xenobiotica]KAK5232987.1 hypothetical protein LTR47_005851 [Exophiala xenobiotica]KAK5245672.1 hypothetical protein LTS06_008918 [Exophiala xenobiotica]KAK5350971.1 hypothetical protein LTR61_005324 [Exophiala xenobiotica]